MMTKKSMEHWISKIYFRKGKRSTRTSFDLGFLAEIYLIDLAFTNFKRFCVSLIHFITENLGAFILDLDDPARRTRAVFFIIVSKGDEINW